jgi:hypothetical protein
MACRSARANSRRCDGYPTPAWCGKSSDLFGEHHAEKLAERPLLRFAANDQFTRDAPRVGRMQELE